jgi:XTP/dITP diphosphohydrolase
MLAADRISLVVASNNPHKIRELRAMLEAAGLPVDVIQLAQTSAARLVVVEDGLTFEDNARKKGETIADATMMLSLADDSGLEVDGLGGRPGVRSARFAHEKATDAENNAALLAALEEVGEGGRRARFRCVLALVDPWGMPGETTTFFDGSCEGTVARVARGAGGFGYDPLFLVEGTGGRTMAELSDDEKNAVSHRGKALAKLLPRLREVVLSRLDDVERVSEMRPSIGDALKGR